MTKPQSPQPTRTGAASGDDNSPTTSGQHLSMHAGVEVWEDCCSCEAEPYWLEAIAATPAGPDNN